MVPTLVAGLCLLNLCKPDRFGRRVRVYDDAENSREGDGDDRYRLGVIAWAEGDLCYLSMYILHILCWYWSYYCVVSRGICFWVCSPEVYFVVSVSE